MIKKITSLILICNAFICIAQNDSIARNRLKEVIVVGKKEVKESLIGKKSIALPVKELTKNSANLTELLRYNSAIVFKDLGNGGISSARFRGTSATNTLVLWNEIPINAVGNGQTDFNSLSASLSDAIVVSSGGSSSENGSGAIGGTVDLKDNLIFKEHQDFNLFASYGDFNTTSNFFKTNIGTGKWAVRLSSSINYSDNDYPFIDDRFSDNDGDLLKNENGAYTNYGVSFSLGYKISEINKLFFYTTGYYGNRFFSAGLPNPSSGNERYEDLNQRNLLKWKLQFGKFKQEVNLSYLKQDYRYYDNIDSENFSFGDSKNYNIGYKLNYRFNNKWSFNGALGYQNFKGITLDINELREVTSFSGNTIYKPTNTTITKLSFRKEFFTDFEVPLSISFDVEQKLSNTFTLKGNYSNNYRVPTFNELYWPQSGNLDLIPEISSQGEIGFDYKSKKLQINTAVFYINTKDRILWLPTGGTNLWRPVNVNETINKGIETFISYNTVFGDNKIKLGLNYAYTVAENTENNRLLPFTPEHFFNLNTSFSRSWFKVYIQSLYQSKVFTNEVNIDVFSLDYVFVNNLGLDFKILNKKKKQLSTGLKVNNILNKLYYFSPFRPSPGRNYNININYKF